MDSVDALHYNFELVFMIQFSVLCLMPCPQKQHWISSFHLAYDDTCQASRLYNEDKYG